MSDALEFAEVPVLFERWLGGRPLADRSRHEYARNGAPTAPGSPRHQTATAGRATR